MGNVPTKRELHERNSLLRSADALEKQAQDLRLRAESFIRAQYIGEIQPEDVGASHQALGRVLSIDVGKRCYYSHGIVQVESQEQLTKRLGL